MHYLTLGFFIPVIVRPLLFPFFCQHELGKKCENGDHMLIVNGESYLSLHLIEKEAAIFYNRLADLLSLKYNTMLPPNTPGCIIRCPSHCYVLRYLPFVGAEGASQ